MKSKKNKGITLIALVVTIIVLVVLAGITINLVLGQKGIIEQAKYASNETTKAAATEKINLKITSAQMEEYAKTQTMPSLKKLSEILKEDDEIAYVLETRKIGAAEYNVPSENPSSIFTRLKEYSYEFEINSSLQLASIDGIKIASSGNNTSGTLLWENPDITTNFVSTTVTLNQSISSFDYIKILSITDTNEGYSMDFPVINNTILGQLSYSWYMSGWAGHPLKYRKLTGTGNTITFNDAYSSGGGQNNAINNDMLKPMYILGFKFK